MNWGRTYKEVSTQNIKERPRREVKVFDLRGYVNAKKKENNPFGGGFPSGFGGSPSFGGGFGSDFSDMFGSMKNDFPAASRPNSESKIDVDRILKNIDAKIAELEEEEKRLDQEDNKENDNSILTALEDDDNQVQSVDNDIENTKNQINNDSAILPDDEFKNLISSFDNDNEFIEKEDNNKLETTDTPQNIDELIDKIKEQSSDESLNKVKEENHDVKENIKPNMNLVEKNKYKEVSDDEFFDDFFD